MKLNRAERDYYVVTITTTPELDGTWEASFDDGATWIAGTNTSGDDWAWLVAGPDFDDDPDGLNPADTQATIAEATVPLLRVADDPVLDIERGPAIRLWG